VRDSKRKRKARAEARTGPHEARSYENRFVEDPNGYKVELIEMKVVSNGANGS
jgi:hypothetical protein